MSRSTWRTQRLLILCYHGISIRDEHEWRPGLYVSQTTFRRRMKMLAEGGYTVLPLGEAIRRLAKGDLPPASVVITFDDGFHDFYKLAFPILKEFGFPATVYLTTHYADRKVAIFNLVTDYLLWRHRGRCFDNVDPRLGDILDLRTSASARYCWQQINDFAERNALTTEDKDAFVASIAHSIGEDYAETKSLRLLQIMDHEEIAQAARNGVDVQLHTHRHRTPKQQELFMREVTENRKQIREITGRHAVHFCYPSGVYAPEFMPWLRMCGVESATTCVHNMCTANTQQFLLPRFLDAENITDTVFESWVSGLTPMFAKRQDCAQVASVD